MICRLARLLWVPVTLSLLGEMSATQAQELPPTPIPVTPDAQPPGIARNLPPALPGPVQPGPGPMLLPPPPPVTPPLYAPYQDNNGPLLRGDPLLDPGKAAPGLFSALELSVLAPHIKNRVSGTVTVDGFEPDRIHLPTSELDWTGSPRLELGYRFPEGLGELLVSYKLLVTEGTARLAEFDLDGNDGFLKSRLNLNSIDIDYASREFSLEPRWDMKWRVGVRVAAIFFDARAEGTFIEQRASNDFVGAGPHAGLDLTRRLDWPGWSFFGRVEAAEVFGRIHQSFEEALFIPDQGNFGAASDIRHTQAAPVVSFQVGLSWVPCWYRYPGRFTFGYVFEQWWDIGRAGDSNANLTDQGIFFRGEWMF
jgi:hypothetical protein